MIQLKVKATFNHVVEPESIFFSTGSNKTEAILNAMDKLKGRIHRKKTATLSDLTVLEILGEREITGEF